MERTKCWCRVCGLSFLFTHPHSNCPHEDDPHVCFTQNCDNQLDKDSLWCKPCSIREAEAFENSFTWLEGRIDR